MTEPAVASSSAPAALPQSAATRFMIGFGFALFGACAYGFNIIFAQIASQSGIMGPTIFFYRVFLMVPIGLLILLVGRTASRLSPFPTTPTPHCPRRPHRPSRPPRARVGSPAAAVACPLPGL